MKKNGALPVVLMVIGGVGMLGQLCTFISTVSDPHKSSMAGTAFIMFIISLIVLLIGVWLRRKANGKGGRKKQDSYWITDDPKKLPKVIRRVRREKDEYTLSKIAKTAPVAEVCCAAVESIKTEYKLESLLKNEQLPDISVYKAVLARLGHSAITKYLEQSSGPAQVRALALESLGDGELESLALSGSPDAQTALRRIGDKNRLRRIATDKKARLTVRIEAYELLGEPDKARLEYLRSAEGLAKEREKAGEAILDTGKEELVRESISVLMAQRMDSVSAAYLSRAAHRYPQLFRGMWPKLQSWAHADANSHTDNTTHAPHVDSTQYYDFYRYPDGRTVPNRGGRKSHTDGPMPTSDCAEYGHTDSNSHTDTDNAAALKSFPPAIREDTGE